MKSFPYESTVVNGKEYIHIKKEDFHLFFIEMMKYANDEEMAQKAITMYEQSKNYKKKRLRIKKEKQALLFMWNILSYYFVKSK